VEADEAEEKGCTKPIKKAQRELDPLPRQRRRSSTFERIERRNDDGPNRVSVQLRVDECNSVANHPKVLRGRGANEGQFVIHSLKHDGRLTLRISANSNASSSSSPSTLNDHSTSSWYCILRTVASSS
jgi:hypothetical protein